MLYTKLVIVSAMLALSGRAFADAGGGGLDLGDDIMKPMGKLMKQIVTDIADPTKNASTVGEVQQVEALVDKALIVDPKSGNLALIPDTDNYTAESNMVGADFALRKYTGLMQALRVTFKELEVTLTQSGTAACANACMLVLTDLKSLQDVGHRVFKDNPPPAPAPAPGGGAAPAPAPGPAAGK